MMCRHPLVPGCAGVWWTALGLALVAGCGVFNPALVGTVTSSSTSGMEPPKGTILISVLNASNASAVATVVVTKQDGSVLTLLIPVQAFDNDPLNEADHVTIAQECDVAAIQATKITVPSATPGEVLNIDLGAQYSPLRDGVDLSCGKVVVITLAGDAPNILADIKVF